jgi:hypothetical protein
MNRRNVLGLVGAGAAAGDLVSQAIAQRTESAAVPAAARLGAMLERDPRWIGYSSPVRIDHYHDLPKPKNDPQMFRPI